MKPITIKTPAMPQKFGSHQRKRSGFTLIELLVVISIIALLISILLPALKSARATARTVICLTKIRTIGLATELYRNDFKLWFPPDALSVTNTFWPTTSAYRYDELITPFIGSSEENFTLATNKNPWLCTENPFTPGWSLAQVRTTGYSANSGMRGNFYNTTRYGWNGGSPYYQPINQIKAPTSEVILVVEVRGSSFNRTNNDMSRGSFLHQGGVGLFAMTDGHAKSSKGSSTTELAVDGMRFKTD